MPEELEIIGNGNGASGIGNLGKLLPVELTSEMQQSYLDYAMSVIVSRALPDVRDGLKPVHRRIIYAMHDMNLHHSSKYTKSAKVVGEVLGKYHPHGDIPVYDALVRLAQEFSLRYPLIDGQGNFGSIDGDPPAAMRYTECRLAAISDEMLFDIDKDTVETLPNFDNTLSEPMFLPAKLPNLLLMGSEGIAVGMATKIPPHNLSELIDAISTLIDKGKAIEKDASEEIDEDSWSIPKLGTKSNKSDATTPKVVSFDSDATIEDLMNHIKGPDFPTHGSIYDSKSIQEVYSTGRGRIVIRGKAEIEEQKGGKFIIAVTEIPYQVNKALMVGKIASLVKDRKIEGISDLRDESDRHGIRVVVELKRDANPKSVLNNLYKHTELQTSFPANMVALVDGTPHTLNLKQILTEYVKHRQIVIRRRSEFELNAARNRAHILEGYLKALDVLDEVIATIRKSPTQDDAKQNLMKKFGFTEIQAVAILDLQLRRLAALERQKIQDEYSEITKRIAYLEDLLAHPAKVLKVIQEELSELKEKFGDERRTKVYKNPVGEISEEDLVASEDTVVTITATGYIKRQNPASFRAQARGGKGVSGMTTKEEDEISHILTANTHDDIFFFTDRGRVFKLKTYELPEGSRQAKGQAVVNLINISQDEKLETVLSLGKNDNTKHLLMVTQKGTIKKTKLSDFANIRTSGIISIKLEKGDSLKWVRPTTGEDHVLLVSHEGKSIKFKEDDVRPTARDTMGVRGILLKPEDFVVGMEVFPSTKEAPSDKRRKVFSDVLIVMENGLGKRTNIKEWPLQNRGGQGVKAAEVTPKTGKIVACIGVDEGVEQVILTSKSAQIIKLPLKNIPQLGRATQGVILMRFAKKGDTVAAVTCLNKEMESVEIAKETE